MKKLILAVVLVLFSTCAAYGASLQWNHPQDWDVIDGWVVYYEADGEDFNRAIPKDDIEHDGETITYTGIHDHLNLHFGTEYTLWLTAYNEHVESEPSNTVTYTREGFSPPGDSLPEGVTINIPAAPVTINIR